MFTVSTAHNVNFTRLDRIASNWGYKHPGIDWNNLKNIFSTDWAGPPTIRVIMRTIARKNYIFRFVDCSLAVRGVVRLLARPCLLLRRDIFVGNFRKDYYFRITIATCELWENETAKRWAAVFVEAKRKAWYLRKWNDLILDSCTFTWMRMNE